MRHLRELCAQPAGLELSRPALPLGPRAPSLRVIQTVRSRATRSRAMKPRNCVSVLILASLLAACINTPASDVQSSLNAAPELYSSHPTNVAILPVEDATPDRRATPHLDQMRSAVARSLVRQLYSPLGPRAVDAPLATEASAQQKPMSVTNAATLQRVAGKFNEDAILGVRVDSWDESSLMADNKVRFSADVALIDSKTKKMLWSGHLNGMVKAGGFGPAPLDRDEKARSAVEEFGWALVQRLPSRGR